MFTLSACEACGGHGPIPVRISGELPEDDGRHVGTVRLDGYETNLCAYCKADLEEDGLTVEKRPRP
jgi:hypothetical protein